MISLSMIIKNEENNLRDCLNSVYNEVDEIVIVDTGSTDNSIQIAKEYTENIFNFTWNNNFSEARNESLKHCTKNWILYLDADERLITKGIKKILENLNENIGGLKCSVSGNHLQSNGKKEKHIMQYPRVFRNDKNIRFTGIVHEQISPSIYQSNFKIIQSDILISHIGYDCTESEIRSKALRNYELLKTEIEKNPLNSFAFYCLAQVLMTLKNYELAIKAIKTSIMLNNCTNEIKTSIYVVYARLLHYFKRYREAIFWCDESLKLEPKQYNAKIVKSENLLQLGMKKEAKEILEYLKKLSEKNYITNAGYDVKITANQIDEILQKITF